MYASQGRIHKNFCDDWQNLPPLVGIGLRYLGATMVVPVAPVVTSLHLGIVTLILLRE